ncbi:dephospho-CoA kinase domain-containing protein-like isoform X1 [Carex littledalei]|uniref:Dephospho-CoA kinase n=1 Tax=Carex littledalei TaxID=544730 RepID=A0A833UXN3_9POAL|nr:dephospho-CoA kinase domain-containing protein-like isoform X1 [Carex littledalei]
MRIVGLTGGISSGKSTISNLFKSHGIPVVDADIVARNVVLKGTGGWKKIKKEFGDDVLLESGDIDRARLGQIVFSDPEKRQLLNRLLAPHISSGIIWEVIKLWFKGCRVIILDIPLLFETKMNLWTKPVIVVWVDPETQIQRLIARDGISEEQARNRIEAQMPLDLKREKADLVIDNSGSLEETKVQFEQVLGRVKSPLSLKESVFSRDGFISVLLSVVVGVIIIKKNVS